MGEIITPNSLEKMFDEINRRFDGLATGYSGIQATADTGVANAATAQTTANSAITIVGTKNTAFYSASAPTANAVNDIWFDSSNGNKLMQWNGSAWASVQDVAIATAQSAATAAASAATAAQTTANGKNAVFRQSTTPTGGTYAIGDMWFNTSNDNAIATWNGASWGPNSLGSNAISYLSASKLTAGTIDASVINVSNINAGNISTGYIASTRIAAGTISVSQLVAGTLAAGNITTGTLTSSVIYTGSINATQIIAGNLVGFDINNGTGTFHVDASGNLSASSATIAGTVTSGNLTATGGTIAGWTISSNRLSANSGTTYLDSSSGLIYTLGGLYTSGSVQANGLTITGSAALTSGATITGNLYNPSGATTTSTANVFINFSTGVIARVTSSIRYKVKIKRESIPLKSIMALKPKSWVDKIAYKENGNSSKGLPRILGLVAEDVAKIPILKDLLVNYDKKGRPDSVNYDRIAIALIELVQELQIRVTQLEAEL